MEKHNVGPQIVKCITLLIALALSIVLTHAVLHFLFNTRMIISVYVHAVLIAFGLVYGKAKRLI